MTFQRIMVTTDLSEAGNRALQVASDLAANVGAKLTLVYVQEDTLSYADGVLPHKDHHEQVDLTPKLTQQLRDAAAAIGCEPDELAVVKDASPVEGILAHAKAKDIDLIVMATQGRSGLRRLLIGSNDRTRRPSRRVRGADGPLSALRRSQPSLGNRRVCPSSTSTSVGRRALN